jgi:hypothetical protein
MILVVVLVRKVDVEVDDADGTLGRVGTARRKLGEKKRRRKENARPDEAPDHAGALPGFHLMLQPMLGF